jgi:hypothetical protein
VDVFVNNAYGNGPFAVRGAIVELTMKNGELLREESIGARWSQAADQTELKPSDDELIQKFDRLTSGVITAGQSSRIKETVWNLESVDSLSPILEVLASTQKAPIV